MAISSQLVMLKIWYDDKATVEPGCWKWHEVMDMRDNEDVELIAADPPKLALLTPKLDN